MKKINDINKTRGALKLFALAVAASAAFLAGTAQAATIWTGPPITFTKADNADWTLPENQDRITTNVWITRQNQQAIYNIKLTSNPTSKWPTDDPLDTKWAWPGKSGNPTDPAQFKAANYAALTFAAFDSMYNIPDVVKYPAVVHLVTDDIYLEVQFTHWTSGGAGGGFSYSEGKTAQMLHG